MLTLCRWPTAHVACVRCCTTQVQELYQALVAVVQAWISVVTAPLGVTPTLVTGEWDPRLMSIIIRVSSD
jgi:hypothetical protein